MSTNVDEQNIELVDMLFEKKLIYGLGISLVSPTKEFIEKIKKYPNVVIHVINGVLKPSDVEALENNDLKLLTKNEVILYNCIFTCFITRLEEQVENLGIQAGILGNSITE